MKPLLSASGLGKSYVKRATPAKTFASMLLHGEMRISDPFWAVRGVDLALGRGESVGIIGRNGSGKSTLLQMICGVTPPTEGQISVNGRVAGLLELGAGFDPEFTGRENVYLNAAILGLNEREITERFHRIEAFADIGTFIDQPVKTYSSGMFVRLAFSVAVHVEPEILVIDEALAVGDAKFSAKCIRRMKELREQGTTLLFVSHDVGIVRTLCDRAIWLDAGKVREEGDVFTVTSKYMEFLFADEAEPKSTGAAAVGPTSADGLEDSRGAHSIQEPLNRWGTAVGAIRSVTMRSSGRENPVVIEYGANVSIEVQFDVPAGCDPAHLSVAFSIKDVRGTDLFVCTSHDEGPGRMAGLAGRASARFDFVNRIVDGKLLLVVALEDRSSEAISYYDYIEGAHLFAAVSRIRRFGIFNLPVIVEVEGK